jgi:hypothetical protein
VSAGLDGLLSPYAAPVPDGDVWTCGGWTATTGPDGLGLAGAGDDLAALRALCAAAWAGSPGDVRGEGTAATGAIERLGLAGDRYLA